MENCVVTKLLGVVSNDNLVKLDQVKGDINVIAALSNQRYNILSITPIDTSKPVTIELTGNHNFYTVTGSGSNAQPGQSQGSTLTGISLSALCIPETGSYLLKISPKYDFYSLTIPEVVSINLEDLKYTRVKALVIQKSNRSPFKGSFGSVDPIISNSVGIMTKLILRASDDIYATAEVIAMATGLTELDITNVSNVTGDFGELGKLVNVPANKFTVIGTSMTGSVESFVRNQVAGNITTKTLSLPYFGGNTGITFNGEPIQNQPTNTLEWEPYGTGQTKITLNSTEVIINNV